MSAGWVTSHAHPRLGPAIFVTAIRAVLVAVLAGAVGTDSEWLPLGVLATVAFILDAVDGRVARETGTDSPFGARVDAELDAVFMMVLSLLVWDLGRADAWVLIAGALRYVAGAAGVAVPWLALAPPPRPSRAWACGVAIVCLCIALVPLPGSLPAVSAALAVLVLVASFGADVVWQWRHRSRVEEPTVARRAAWVVVAFAALNVGLNLPAVATGHVWGPWLSADVFVLACTVAFLKRAWATRLAAAAWLVLFVYQVIRLVSAVMMSEEALLYELVHLLKHLVVLVGDLYGYGGLFAVLAFCALLAIVGLYGAWRGLDLLARESDRLVRIPTLPAVAVVGGVALIPLIPGQLVVGWIAPELGRNAVQSIQHLRSLASLVQQTPHAHLADLEIARKPDFHFYIVEAYGAVSFTMPVIFRHIAEPIGEMERQFERSGLHVASGYAIAPVSGGRSWQADATVLLGRHVAQESTYYKYLENLDRVTHMPGFLGKNGYRTLEVRANHRKRPGFTITNDFGYSRPVIFDDLNYTGPRVGWGIVPDQYTLGWIREVGLKEVEETPTFVFNHLATSHGPWNEEPPPLLDDWREWNDMGEGFQDPPDAEDGTFERVVVLLKAIRRQGRKFREKKVQTNNKSRESLYGKVIAYDLKALGQHITQIDSERPAVYILMGDHQPYWIAREKSYAVPVHVIATDRALLRPFKDWGFQLGMTPRPSDRAPRHEDLFEILAEILTIPRERP